MNLYKKYFPELNEIQLNQLNQLEILLSDWNSKINVISRKDIEHVNTRHILHSLSIGFIQKFKPNASILDVGTGGGLPGIPLAIMFPEVQFHLIDVIQKKIKVVQAIIDTLELKNVTATQIRAENVSDKYDFIVSRAVTNMTDLHIWVKDKTKKENNHDLRNGLLCLKGGDLSLELEKFPNSQEFELNTIFEDEFFDTKKVVYQPIKYRL